VTGTRLLALVVQDVGRIRVQTPVRLVGVNRIVAGQSVDLIVGVRIIRSIRSGMLELSHAIAPM
jgi:hypothetical protein